MYINLKYLAEVELDWLCIFALQMVKQQRYENCEVALEELSIQLSTLEEKGFIKSIKGKSTDSGLSKIRITKSGDAVLSNVETPGLLEEDLKIFEWLQSIYLGLGKKVGNIKKTKRLIANFRAQSGINRNKLAYLVSTFINDTENMEYNNILEYCFHKPANSYSTKFKLEESRLYNYYLANQDHFDKKFEKL